MSKKGKKDDTEVTEVTAEPTETAMPEGAEGAATLTMKDLQAIGRIFELAVQRGAFRANEMTTVGGVYDKLNQFLAHVAASQEAAEGEGEGAEGEGAEGAEAVQEGADTSDGTTETSEA